MAGLTRVQTRQAEGHGRHGQVGSHTGRQAHRQAGTQAGICVAAALVRTCMYTMRASNLTSSSCPVVNTQRSHCLLSSLLHALYALSVSTHIYQNKKSYGQHIWTMF